MIDISKMNKSEVLAKLFNSSRVQGMGFLHPGHNVEMTSSEAQQYLDESKHKYFDYLNGRVMKVNLSGEEFDPRLYDRDNGQGAAAKAIRHIIRGCSL